MNWCSKHAITTNLTLNISIWDARHITQQLLIHDSKVLVKQVSRSVCLTHRGGFSFPLRGAFLVISNTITYNKCHLAMPHWFPSWFSTLKKCPPEIKMTDSPTINERFRVKYRHRYRREYLLHLYKKERKHFALIFAHFIPSKMKPALTLKGQLSLKNRHKNHITNYRNKKSVSSV